jgi:hypothetical protein
MLDVDISAAFAPVAAVDALSLLPPQLANTRGAATPANNARFNPTSRPYRGADYGSTMVAI